MNQFLLILTTIFSTKSTLNVIIHIYACIMYMDRTYFSLKKTTKDNEIQNLTNFKTQKY